MTSAYTQHLLNSVRQMRFTALICLFVTLGLFKTCEMLVMDRLNYI